MHIERPKLGQITQGTIFSAARAENYSEMPIWGLCITARCDVAHETKTEVFNYIPIVRFEDWLQVEGHRIISRRIANELKNSLESALKAAGYSGSVLDTYTARSVTEKFFPLDVEKPEVKRQKLHVAAENLDKLLSLQECIKLDKKQTRSICEISPKTFEKVARELWSNQLSGYYFIPKIGDTEFISKSGYVALLREVHHITRSTASAIAQGLTQEICDAKKISELNFGVQDFSCPVGKVSSPWIEHFMQQFATLFTRIGLPDPSEEQLAPIYEAYKYE